MIQSVPHVVLVALGMVPSTVGTMQSGKNFQRALQARVISCTDPDQLAAENTAISEALHVRTRRGRLGAEPAWQKRACFAEPSTVSCRISLTGVSDPIFPKNEATTFRLQGGQPGPA